MKIKEHLMIKKHRIAALYVKWRRIEVSLGLYKNKHDIKLKISFSEDYIDFRLNFIRKYYKDRLRSYITTEAKFLTLYSGNGLEEYVMQVYKTLLAQKELNHKGVPPQFIYITTEANQELSSEQAIGVAFGPYIQQKFISN